MSDIDTRLDEILADRMWFIEQELNVGQNVQDVLHNAKDELQYKIKQLMADEFEKLNEIDGNTSDGYHTFNELYHYRMLYNALYVNEIVKHNRLAANKSKRNADGKLCFGGEFVVTMYLSTGQVTNHYELKDWDKFHCDELDTAPMWDGLTSQEAANRLEQELR